MSEVQSVVFPRNKWCKQCAVNWLKQEGYKTSFKNDDEEKYSTQYRYRQTDPKKYNNFTTKKILNGKILLIIGHK
mgnify:CR=1 FL=1